MPEHQNNKVGRFKTKLISKPKRVRALFVLYLSNFKNESLFERSVYLNFLNI